MTKKGIMSCALLLIVLSTLLTFLLSCSGGSITATSDSVGGHSHEVTISISDINSQPAEKIITTSSAGTPAHTHMIRLTNSSFRALSEGMVVNLTSSPASETDSHTHKFRIQYQK